ncbi:translation initiation factor IF-2-like [Moschus berezovskii]|uniref:translation initiation factor IF-2-like n=1 Tax=Moschus berezovskii TaxID=68408 RepID=UPI00244448E1|nr:translation initiation factor IF-2-like [Moschus berezovskii]
MVEAGRGRGEGGSGRRQGEGGEGGDGLRARAGEARRRRRRVLVWSRHDRPGPAAAQPPHNNPPGPASPPSSARRPSRPRRALRRRRYHSAPQGGSGRRAGEGGGGCAGGRGRGGEAPLAGGPGRPRRALRTSRRRRGRPAGLPPRGRCGARAEARARGPGTLLPARGGRTRSARGKGRRRPEAPESRERLQPLLSGASRQRGALETPRRVGRRVSGLPRLRRGGGARLLAAEPGGLGDPRPGRPEERARAEPSGRGGLCGLRLRTGAWFPGKAEAAEMSSQRRAAQLCITKQCCVCLFLKTLFLSRPCLTFPFFCSFFLFYYLGEWALSVVKEKLGRDLRPVGSFSAR